MNSIRSAIRFLKWSAVAAAVLLLIAYVGAYVQLRARGLREMADYNSEGFFYDHIATLEESHDFSTHQARYRFFRPLNWIDHVIFNGPRAIHSVLHDIN